MIKGVPRNLAGLFNFLLNITDGSVGNIVDNMGGMLNAFANCVSCCPDTVRNLVDFFRSMPRH